MEKLEFSCCFCNQGIIESKTNPLDINIMHNIDILNKTGRGQSFYAHFDCLKEKLHPYVQTYFFNFENEEQQNTVRVIKNQQILIRKIIELKNIDQWKVIYYGLHLHIIDNNFVMDYCFARIERNEPIDQFVLDIAGLTHKDEINAIPKMIEAKIHNPQEVWKDENKVYSKIWSYLTLAAEIHEQRIID